MNCGTDAFLNCSKCELTVANLGYLGVMPRYMEIKAPDGSVYKCSSNIGDNVEKVSPALHIGAYKFYQLTQIAGYPEDVARQMSIDTVREYANKPCPDFMKKLFNKKKKKEQEALLKKQSITSENLISWFLEGGRSKGLFSEYSCEVPDKELEGRKPLLIDATDPDNIKTVGTTDLSNAALKHLVENQHKVIAQFVDFDDGRWFCFYRTFKGMSGREMGNQGEHMHFISNAYGLDRNTVVEGFKKGECPKNGYHVHFRANS